MDEIFAEVGEGAGALENTGWHRINGLDKVAQLLQSIAATRVQNVPHASRAYARMPAVQTHALDVRPSCASRFDRSMPSRAAASVS